VTPLLFIDRDGTLIEEPADFQIDAFDKLRFVDGAIPALLRLRDAGYQFILISNQDGLGSAAFPSAAHRISVETISGSTVSQRRAVLNYSPPPAGRGRSWP